MNLSTSNNIELRAVKALIYSANGKILLQKRDNNKSIPYPLHWNFFGGEAEQGENLIDALKRELFEELEYLPDEIGNEIFQSSWKSYSLHFFPIFINDVKIEFILHEGIEYRWFNFHELVSLDLVPAIYENLYSISSYLHGMNHKFKEINEIIYEKKLIEHLNISKKNDRVYYANNDFTNIKTKDIYLFLFLSQLKNVPVSRICLHNDDSSHLHEMYMFHTLPFNVGPLKQNKESISYHIFDGLLEIKVKKEGKNKTVILSSDRENSDAFRSYRLKPNEFRLVKSKSKYCIFLEINNGPFKDADTIWFETTD